MGPESIMVCTINSGGHGKQYTRVDGNPTEEFWLLAKENKRSPMLCHNHNK
jgi:hypothetical protein